MSEEKLTLFWEQKEQGLKKLFKEFWYDKALNESDVWSQYVPKGLQEEMTKYCGKRNRKGRYKYIMFTINFKPDVDLERAMKRFKKYTKKKWILKHYSCFEWRDIEKGLHIHSKVWVDPKKDIYDCKREVYNTFKHLVGNKMCINAKYSNTDNCFEKYIDGLKKGKEKDSLAISKAMRIKYKIPDIITTINE